VLKEITEQKAGDFMKARIWQRQKRKKFVSFVILCYLYIYIKIYERDYC